MFDIPFNIKKIAYSLMSRKITTVISFKIESTFEEWIKSHKVDFSSMEESSWI